MIQSPVQLTKQVLLAGAVFLLGGCSATDTGEWPEDRTDTTERPLTVCAQMEAEVVTRAASALETGTMAVFRKTTNGYAALNNIPYTWDAATKSWKSADADDKDKTIYVDHRDAQVYAYYPYNPSQGSSTTFSLAMGRNTPAKTMLYSASQTVNNRTALASFAMKSGYSRVTFRIQNTNLPSYRITKAAVSFVSAVKSQGTIDISATTPTTTAGSTTVSSFDFGLAAGDSIYDSGIGTGQYDETADLLMIPGQSLPTMTFTIELSMPGASTKYATISATIPAATVSGSLIQGKQYIIPLLLSGTTITFNQTVPPLGDITDTDPFGEDKLTAYTLPPVTVNGVNVATGNLYFYESELISSAQNPNYVLDGKNNWYCFAGRSGKMWPEKDKTATNTFTSSTERCERLGSNWYCPSAADLQALAAATRSGRVSYSESSTTAYGYWIGATSANKTTAIFLQEGNYVAKDGGYLQVNSSGITFQSGSVTGYVRCMSTQQY